MESELKDGEVVLRMPVNEAAALRIALSRHPDPGILVERLDRHLIEVLEHAQGNPVSCRRCEGESDA